MKGWKFGIIKEGNVQCKHCKGFQTKLIARTDNWKHFGCLDCNYQWEFRKIRKFPLAKKSAEVKEC